MASGNPLNVRENVPRPREALRLALALAGLLFLAAFAALALIRAGGPFPHARDGRVFANREGLLPPAARGTYREYTVMSPGRRDRGARRIVAIKRAEFYYT